MKDKNNDKLNWRDWLSLILFSIFIFTLCVCCKYYVDKSTNKTHKVSAIEYNFNGTNSTITLDSLILNTSNHLYAYIINIPEDEEFCLDLAEYDSTSNIFYLVGLQSNDNENISVAGLSKLDSNYYLYCDLSSDLFVYVYDYEEESNVISYLPDNLFLLSNIDNLANAGHFDCLTLTTLNNVCTKYNNVFINNFNISTVINDIGRLANQSGYNIGYDAGYLKGLEDAPSVDSSFSWLSVFNSFFTIELFPNFKIYYLLVFSLGIVIFKTIAKSLFRG